jgi:peptidoglycan/LPS O-acetylase OafA/YrhL
MRAPANLKPLTALRIFAALWVVVFDYWPNLGLPTPSIVAKGYLGVELFFTLSGFILCHVYLRQVEENRFRYGAFLWARLARIYPMHLATIAAIGLMGAAALAFGHPVDANAVSWRALPANLLLINAWGASPVSGWNHASWSISAEWFAYLLFPAFAFAALKLKDRPRLAIGLAVAFMTGLYAVFSRLTGQSLTHATIAWGALRIVPCFAFGCAAYLAWRADLVRSSRPAWAGAAISGAALITFAQFGAPDAAIVAASGGLILSLAFVSKTWTSGHVLDAFVYLGEISYSVYMLFVPWQLLFVNVTAKALHYDKSHMPVFVWLVFVTSIIPLAAISHHLIERPARSLMRRGLPRFERPFATVA